MDEEEYLQCRRTERIVYRCHCDRFSRMGWALLSILAASLGISIAALPLLRTVPALVEEPLFQWLVSLFSVYGVGFFLFCMIISPVPSVPPRERKPLGPLRFGQVYLISIAALYLSSFLSVAVLNFFGDLLDHPISNPISDMLEFPIPLTLSLTCLAAPICEELIFRKLMLDRLRPYGDRFAVMVSALAFGLLHGNFYQFLYAFALGCVFGYVVLRTGCVWQTMLLHALINGISAGLLPLAEHFGERGETVLSVGIVAAIGLGILFFVTSRRELYFEPGDAQLSEGRKWRILFGSPGFLLFGLCSIAQAIWIVI